ncbi:hypothetical protein D3C81_1731370 [compost metagenome]
MEYLNDRVEWSDQQAVDQRLRTHLLDYKLLGEARYKDETGIPLSGTALSDKLGTDFATFLSWRAQRVALAATKLAEGSLPSIEVLMAEAGQAG